LHRPLYEPIVDRHAKDAIVDRHLAFLPPAGSFARCCGSAASLRDEKEKKRAKEP
jgi:hypothetical protein